MSQSPPVESLVLDSLPTEIQDLIFHYVVLDSSIDELKLFRQSNRYFRDRADIYLFRTLHISASTASLERVKRVSENDRLNVHVRELVFHRGTFFGHKMARAARSFEVRARDYDDFETYVVRSSTKGARVGLMNISRCYANFNEELEFESRFNQDMTWRSSLRGPLSRFSKLEKLTTLTSENDLESKYLRKRCALTHQSWTPNYFAPYEIFEPCGRDFMPKSLSMDSVNGEDFASVISNIRGGEDVVKARFVDLKYLRLSFSETVNTLEVEGTWDVFIRSCTSLETLSLDFESFYSPKMLKEPDSFPQMIIKLFLQQTYPRMKTLDLKYALMTEHDFIDFLDRHQNTLTTLKLRRWAMPVDSSDLPTGSIIRAFWRIGQLPKLQLKEVQIRDEFSNRADGDGWNVVSHIIGDMDFYRRIHIRARLEHYMRKDPDVADAGFPVPITKEQMDEAKTGKQMQDLDRIPFEKGFEDDSFEWWEDPLPPFTMYPYD